LLSNDNDKISYVFILAEKGSGEIWKARYMPLGWEVV